MRERIEMDTILRNHIIDAQAQAARMVEALNMATELSETYGEAIGIYHLGRSVACGEIVAQHLDAATARIAELENERLCDERAEVVGTDR
jgi:polysaccharide deacetylase 2 family uncharacterized protein YibQ